MPRHSLLTGAQLHDPKDHLHSSTPGDGGEITPSDIGAATSGHDHDADYAPISVVGTVTSVGLSMPADFSVSGSPVTTSGTLAVTAANQNANIVKAGPASGAAAAPTYRSLVADDLPATTPDVPWAATANVTIANTTTPTSLLSTNTGSRTIPAAFWAVGRSFRLKLWGYYKVSVGTPAGSATITLSIAGTDILTAGITFPSDTGGGDLAFEAEFLSTCRVTGGSGSLMSQGIVRLQQTDNPVVMDVGAAAQPMSAVTVALNASATVSALWAWDTADADNTVTVTNALLELL